MSSFFHRCSEVESTSGEGAAHFAAGPGGMVRVEADEGVREARIDPRLARASVSELNQALLQAFGQEEERERGLFGRPPGG